MIKSVINRIDVHDGVAMISIEGFAGRCLRATEVFSEIAQSGADIGMIIMIPSANDRMNLSFTVPENCLGKTVAALGSSMSPMHRFLYHISSGNTKIILSGVALCEDPHITSQVLKVLSKAGIEVKLISATVNEIALLVEESDADAAIGELKRLKTNN